MGSGDQDVDIFGGTVVSLPTLDVNRCCLCVRLWARAAHESFNLMLTRAPLGGYVSHSQDADTGLRLREAAARRDEVGTQTPCGLF